MSEPALTPQFLGYQLTPAGWRKVFVVWLEDPDSSLAAQMPGSYVCAECGVVNDLRHVAERRDHQNPVYTSTSVACACHASVHFDKTAAAERASLTWTTMFRSSVGSAGADGTDGTPSGIASPAAGS